MSQTTAARDTLFFSESGLRVRRESCARGRASGPYSL